MAHVSPLGVGARCRGNEVQLANEQEHLTEADASKGSGTVPPAPAKGAALDLKKREPELLGIPTKWISLALLTLQTSGQALLIRWSRADGQAPYLGSTVVFFVEVMKTLCSLVCVVIESRHLSKARRSISRHFAERPGEVLKASVPAIIYTIQNNLMFYSLGKLSAPVQQVLYQMKILTTAALGVVLLGNSLTATKWSACVLLAVGVALVQWPRHPLQAGFDVDQVKGFLAVLLACFTSGFSAVFIQKMLQQTTASVWMRNVQFGLFGSCMGLLVALGHDGGRILKDGFLQGYSLRVVAVIAMNSIGGLLCAVNLKYAGATLGCFSTALSIILTCLMSWALLQDFEPDALFVAGSLLAVSATLLFGLGAPAALGSWRRIPVRRGLPKRQ